MNKIVETSHEYLIILRGLKKNIFFPEKINLEHYFINLQEWCRNTETNFTDVSIVCTLLDNGGTLYDCEDESFFEGNPLENSEENIYILLVINGADEETVKSLTEHQLFQVYFKYIEVRPAETIYY
jgi:hypothetical protein